MTFKNFHRVSFFLLLFCLLAGHLTAQKKRKNAGQPFGMRQQSAEGYFTEGEKYYILEDYAKALFYYQKCQELDPSSSTVYYKMAEVLAKGSRQEDLQKASAEIEAALKIEKDNKYYYQLAANIYNGLGKFDRAAEKYEDMIREVPGTEEYLLDLAAIYQYAQKPDDAIKVYNRAESVLGINETSSIQKQRLYLELGKTKEAISEGEKLIRAFPDEERYVMGFSELLAQKGQRPLGISYLEKFVEEHDGVQNAEMLLAGMYRDSGDEKKAETLLLPLFEDLAVDLNSKVIILGSYSNEINSQRTSGRADAHKIAFALELYAALARAYPEESNVHILGGDLFLSVGKNPDAKTEYLKAISLGNRSFEVYQNLIYIESELNQFDNMIEHSDNALELYPNQGMLYYFNGYAHFRRHHFPEAINALSQVSKYVTNNQSLLLEANCMLGDAYNATHDYLKSDAAFEQALVLDPSNASALNNYSYYLSLRKENLDKADKMAALLVKNNPDNPTYLDTYAWVLYVKGKYKDARKAIERAIQTGQANATHLEHYGDILYQLGDVDDAVLQWEKALRLNSKNETLNKKIANRKIYE